MAQEGFKRKLTSIFSADAVGYSLLMGDDEATTVKTLKSYHNVISSLVKQHNGNVIDSPGDNLLAEFASVVDAVQCAVAVQKELKTRNDELPENRRMQFRIGINLGDVIQEDERIYGDGVNIAARLEGLAKPGGICISKTAFDHIESKLPYGYEFLGDQSVKNIAKPVGAYRVLMDPRVTVSEKAVDEKHKAIRRMPILVGAIMAVILAVAVGIWYLLMPPTQPPIETASIEKMAYPLPDKPSIAVLPFVNTSHDPEKEYFSDGLTDDLITGLSKISSLFVIGRNSSFTYKGKPVKIRQVAEELGVRYVLEGSVRIAENMVRVNAQLIDATTGSHLWAERFDEKIIDIFFVQDKITRKIIEALAIKLAIDEKEAIPEKETDNLEAYIAFLKGWESYRRFNPDGFSKAISYFEKAIRHDPNYWHAYAALAKVYLELRQRPSWRRSLGLSFADASSRRYKYLDIAMKGPTPLAHRVAVESKIEREDFEGAIAEATQALNLDSNDPESHSAMGLASLHAGRHREAAYSFKQAMRLDPFYKDTFGYTLGMAYFFMLKFKEAADLFERAYKNNPQNQYPLWFLPAAYAHLDRQPEAEIALSKLRKVQPRFSYLKYLKNFFKFKDPADFNLLYEGLRKAGMYPTVREAHSPQ